MSTTYYAAPGAIVCVETGMPERAVRIGIGRTVGAARADLSETPMQSAGRDPVADALAWARNAAWLDMIMTPEQWASRPRQPRAQRQKGFGRLNKEDP